MALKALLYHLDDSSIELHKLANALANPLFGNQISVQSFDKHKALVAACAANPPDIAVVDLYLDNTGESGLDTVRWLRGAHANCVILVCSSADDATTIAECLAAGADDFISKASDNAELGLRVINAYRLARLKRGLPEISDALPPTRPLTAQFVGATMQGIAARAPQIIRSAIGSVFVKGESGTGKEIVASIFEAVLPKGLPFVKVNCGAITPTLLESELFGHIKGSFTGATADKRGYFETANGGWVFLDEVATLSPSAQVALLRVLESQEVLPVGASKPIPVNTRLIAATNESMEALIAEGKFRQDLWQRLCETEIKLPPIAERPGEIALLIEHFCRMMRGGPYLLTKSTLDLLCAYDWREGNVREIRNCLRSMTEFQVDGLLTPLAIPERIMKAIGEKLPQQPLATESHSLDQILSETLSIDLKLFTGDFENLENQLLIDVIKVLARGNVGPMTVRHLGRTLGIPRTSLVTRLKRCAAQNQISMEELMGVVNIKTDS